MAGSRASWRETNLDAEARRQVRYTGVHPNLMQDLADKVAARAAGAEHSVRIGMDTEVAAAVPIELTRGDGQSIFRMAKGQLYTSPAILAAEARVVAAAGRLGGRVIEAGDVRIAQSEWSANNGGAVLNTAQAAMVTDIGTNPAMVQLALAPGGTGKTTVMGVLARAWMSTGGQVGGLAPQASAAKELATAIPGVEADGRQGLHAQAVEQDRQFANEAAERAEALTAAADQAADNAARYAAEQQHRTDHPESAVLDHPAPSATTQGTHALGFGPDDKGYNTAFDWSYRPEIHDRPPTSDHGIER